MHKILRNFMVKCKMKEGFNNKNIENLDIVNDFLYEVMNGDLMSL